MSGFLEILSQPRGAIHVFDKTDFRSSPREHSEVRCNARDVRWGVYDQTDTNQASFA